MVRGQAVEAKEKIKRKRIALLRLGRIGVCDDEEARRPLNVKSYSVISPSIGSPTIKVFLPPLKP